MLNIEAVTVQYGAVKALDNVSMSIGSGVVSGLIGPNGSGKTTLVNAVMGQVRCTAGTVSVGGVRMNALPTHKRRSVGVTRTFQNLELSGALTVRENLELAVRGNRSVRRRQTAELARQLAGFGLEPVLDTPVARLPYGIRKLVELARAMLGEPRLILLDEAAAGLNSQAKALVADQIQSVASERGPTILVIEHDVAFLERLAASLTVLDAGKVIASGPFTEVISNDAVRDAYLGVGRVAGEGHESGRVPAEDQANL